MPPSRDFMSEGPFVDFGAAGGAIADVIAASIQAAGRDVARQLQAIAEVFVRRAGDPGDMLAVHQKVGELAQDSVKRSYDQLVTAREGWASRQHYRAGASNWHARRFANRVMRNALGDGDFFEATANGLLFVNVTMLNRRAAQWHRLAFGAGQRGIGSSQRFPMSWGNLVVATLAFDEPASPSFVMPRGVFVGPEGPVKLGQFAAGSDMFFPGGEARAAGLARNITKRPRPTRGIAAKNFLDAGLRRIGQELPIAYGQLYGEWWGQAKAGAGPLTQISTQAARPVTLQSRVRTV